MSLPLSFTAIPGMRQAISSTTTATDKSAADSNSADSKNANSNINAKDGDSSSKLARIEAKLEADVERVVQEVDGELW